MQRTTVLNLRISLHCRDDTTAQISRNTDYLIPAIIDEMSFGLLKIETLIKKKKKTKQVVISAPWLFTPRQIA